MEQNQTYYIGYDRVVVSSLSKGKVEIRWPLVDGTKYTVVMSCEPESHSKGISSCLTEDDVKHVHRLHSKRTLALNRYLANSHFSMKDLLKRNQLHHFTPSLSF